MSRISCAVDINAPSRAVWALLQDVRRLPEYSPSTLEVTDAPDRITGVGQTYSQVGKLLGRRYRSVWTVTDLDPGHRIRSEGSLGGGIRYCLTQTLESLAPDCTRLEIDVEYSLPGGILGRLPAKAGVESRAAKEVDHVLEGVRRTVEATTPQRHASA